jgi:predicted aspartyl protease
MLATASDAIAQTRCKFARVVEWPIRFVHGQIVFDGAINGKKVGIVIDTGMAASLILRSTAERLDLPRHEVRSGGIMLGLGETRVETAVVDEFKLGDAKTTSITFYVAGDRVFSEGEDVLLGQDFLRNFDVEFDLANRAVRLFAPKDCDHASLAYWTKETAGEVELDPFRGWPYRITFDVSINGRKTTAQLDSGASMSYMSRADAAAAGIGADTPGVVRAGWVSRIRSESTPLWTGTFRTFAIGNETIDNPKIHFGDSLERSINGAQPMLLGVDFLRSHRTLVSHSQHRMYFTYIGGPVFAPHPPPAPEALK